MAGTAGYRVGEIVNIAASLESFMGRPENVDMLDERSVTGNPKNDGTIQKENELKESISRFISYTKLQENTLQRQMIPAMGDQNFAAKLQLSRERFITARQHQINEITEIGKQISRYLRNAEKTNQKNPEFHRFLGNFAAECGLAGTKAQMQLPGIHMMYDDAQQKHQPEVLNQNPELASRGEMTLNAAAASFRPKTVDVTGLKALGSGGINTVYSYHDPDTNTERVVKIGSQHLFEDPLDKAKSAATGVFEGRLGHRAIDGGWNYEERMDGVIQADFKFIDNVNRDVSVSRVDQMLGFGIITKTDFGVTPEGQPVSVMDKVPGNVVDDLEFTMDANPAAGVISLKNQSLINQLYELQAVDVIAGHMDRHVGNYMIHVNEAGELKVKGIDNDTSFSVKEPELTFTGGVQEVFPRIQTAFDFVPGHVYDRVKDLGKEDLVRALGGLMSEKQINVAGERLEYLKAHFAELDRQGKVVRGPFSEEQMQQLYEPKKINRFNANASCYHTDICHNHMTRYKDRKEFEAEETRKSQERARRTNLGEKPLQNVGEIVNLSDTFQAMLNQPGAKEMLNAPKASHFTSKKKEQANQEFDMKGKLMRFCHAMAEYEHDVTSPMIPGDQDPNYARNLNETGKRAVDARTYQIELMEQFAQTLSEYMSNPANQKYGDPKFNKFLTDFAVACGTNGMKAKAQIKGISDLYENMERKHRAQELHAHTAPAEKTPGQPNRVPLNPNAFMQGNAAPANNRAERAAAYAQRQKNLGAERPRANSLTGTEKAAEAAKQIQNKDKGKGLN